MKYKFSLLLLLMVNCLVLTACGPEDETNTYTYDDCTAPESDCAAAFKSQAEDHLHFIAQTRDPDVYQVGLLKHGAHFPANEPQPFYCYCTAETVEELQNHALK